MGNASSTVDFLAKLGPDERADMLTKVDRAFDASHTPPDLAARFRAFAEENGQHVDSLEACLLGFMCTWLTKGREAGADPDCLEQVWLQAAQRAIAYIARAMKDRQGEPFDPARLAIVAWSVGEAVGAVEDFRGDIDGAADLLEQWAAEGTVDDGAPEGGQ